MLLDEKELELSIETMDEKQLQKWTTGVQWLVLFTGMSFCRQEI